MDLVDTGTDPWILEHEACERVAREIGEQLIARDREKVSSQVYNAISGKIRIRLKQYANEVNELNKKLTLASVVSSLTPEERERRQRQVEVLQSKEVQLRESFNQRISTDSFSSNYDKSRNELFKKRERSTGVDDDEITSWGEIGNSSNARLDSKTTEELKEEQERLLKEQDEGLENLLKIVTAQTKIARTINDEVEYHNEILVDIQDGMERVDGRMNKATNMIKVIGKKQSIWGYWLVALLLFIAILGVAFS